MLWILPDNLCFYIGLITVVWTFVKIIYKFLLPPLNLFKRYKGGWAVVTGGSDGIGLGFCEELARMNFNICVISRNKAKIDNVCQQLKQINPDIQTRTVVADFADSFKPQFYQNILKQIQDLDISILVNNIGYLIDISPFHEVKPEQIFKQTTLNVMPISMMTRMILPKMLKREKSGIVCLSSFSINFILKNSANYCATKLFDHVFSHALSYQCKNKIDFLSVKPGLVTTPMSRNTTSFVHSSKNQCAKGALNALGRYSTYGGSKWHQLQNIGVNLLPQIIRDKVVAVIWKNLGQTYRQLDLKNQKKQ